MFVDSLLNMGYGRWDDIQRDMQATARSVNATAQTGSEADRASAKALLSAVDGVDKEDLMYYTLGWLKLLYTLRYHKALHKRVDDSEEEDEQEKRRNRRMGQKQRYRLLPVGKRGGHTSQDAIELPYGEQLAADARRVVKEERERRRKQRIAEMAALTSTIVALDAEAARAAVHAATVFVSIGSAASATAPATAGVIVDFDADLKQRQRDATTTRMAVLRKEEEEDNGIDDAAVESMHFLELIERIPVYPGLLHPAVPEELRRHSIAYLKTLQMAHQLQWFIKERDGRLMFDQWFSGKTLNIQFRKGGQAHWVVDNVAPWWELPNDDWQLLKGLWYHGVDRVERVPESVFLDFKQRIGTTVTKELPNPAFAQLRDAAVEASKEGPEAEKAARALYEAAPMTIPKVIRITWPSQRTMEMYVSKLMNAVKYHFKETDRRAAKQRAEQLMQQQMQQERERRYKQQQEEQAQREQERATHENKLKADEALRRIIQQQQQPLQQQQPALLDKQRRDDDDRSDVGDEEVAAITRSERAIVLKTLSAGGLAKSSSPLPRVSESPKRRSPSKKANQPPPINQQSITTFFGAKPKLPLIRTPTSSSRHGHTHTSSDDPPSAARTSTSSTASSSSSSSSPSLFAPANVRNSSSPASPFPGFAPSPHNSTRAKPLTGWAMTLPRQSSAGEDGDEDEEGDVDEDEEDDTMPLPELIAMPRHMPPRLPPRPPTPKPRTQQQPRDEIDLLSDTDDF